MPTPSSSTSECRWSTGLGSCAAFDAANTIAFKKLATIEIRKPQLSYVSAVDAKSHSDPQDIRALLVKQLASPVRWIDTVRALAATGIYLWWPRAIEKGKPRLAIRWAKGGRIRWRDLHAATGILVSVVLIGYIVSGLTWSRYWGENWRAVAATLTPPTEIEAPSTPAKVGDFDRLGRRIAWADKEDPVYASPAAGATSKPLTVFRFRSYRVRA